MYAHERIRIEKLERALEACLQQNFGSEWKLMIDGPAWAMMAKAALAQPTGRVREHLPTTACLMGECEICNHADEVKP